MSDALRTAIETADVTALRRLLSADPARANELIRWGEGGKNVVPALHYVFDAVFQGLATQEQALELARSLLDAGVDPNQVYAKSGDTYLIAAASLGAERVGQYLVERGADIAQRGLFGATALHWAAYVGLEHLALALVEAGAELELRDTRYECTPLEWALHGWTAGTNGERERLPIVVRLLRERGARVPADASAALTTDSDAAMRAALLGASSS
jgi:hypothetical protein